MAEPTMAVGDVAARSGVSVSALHFYEARGLIQAQRSGGNQRRYRRDVLRRIAFIRAAQRIGIDLDAIATALQALPDQRTPTKADWTRLSRGWRQQLDTRISELLALRDQLDGCIGCGCLSLKACQLYNRADALALQGPGARRLLARGD